MSTISLCMIVRNEEQTLARCLRSVEGIPDEIVIVDTGSQDTTKSIAEMFTDKVLDFEWIDDFAAARNHAFEHAGMDFILWLDSDDVLLPEDRDKLLQLKASLSPDVDAVSMIYNVSFDGSNNVIQSTRRLRLVRRARNFRWEGVVHEDLETEGEYRYLQSDIAVTHKKPPSEAGPSKRNLSIYEKHFADGKQMRPADQFNFARELKMNREFEKAIPYYEQFLANKDIDVNLALYALHELASCYFMAGDVDKEWECTLRSFELDVPRPEFSCRVGERLIKDNRFRAAIFWYELALQDPGGEGAAYRAVENYPYKTWLPHKQLGLCYYQVGDLQRSLHHNQRARGYLPNDADIQTNITMLEQALRQSRQGSLGPQGS